MGMTEKVCVVTGAGSGIGRAVAEKFLRNGDIVLGIDISCDGLDELSLAAVSLPGLCSVLCCDVEDKNLEKKINESLDQYGSPNVLVVSAAMSIGGNILTTTTEDWFRVLGLNVVGAANCVKAVVPEMIKKGNGSIVTVGSQLAWVGARNSTSYAASKGALISMTKAIALDYGPHGIRANVVMPGAIETPFFQRALQRTTDPDSERSKLLERYPLGRFGEAEDVADTVAFLASEEAKFITGAVLPVDGGRVID